MSNKRMYYLVIYDNAVAQKGDSVALKSIISEAGVNIILQDAGATITRKECGNRYKITSKKIFEYVNVDGSKTTFIIADADKQKK